MVLLAVGCSKQKSTVPAAQFILHAGDIASPVVVTTNNVGGTNIYSISVEFSGSQQVRFREFQQEHQNQDIEIMAGSRQLWQILQIQGVMSPVSFKVPYASQDDAQAMSDALNKLSER